MAKGDFFSPNRKTSSKDKQIASSMSSGSYGGYVDAGERRGFVSKEQAESMLANPERYKMRPSEIKYLRQSMPFTDKVQSKPFFSQELGQIASATSDLSGLLANKQPLSPIGSDTYNKEVEGFIKEMKESPFYRRNFDLDTGERIDKYFNPIPGEAKFGEEEMRRDYPYRRQFRYDTFDGPNYTPGVQNFSSPITADARTIGQIRADPDARMRENARLRNESFQRGERVQQKSADVTYGTNMLSNPAFGFRGKMTDAAKAKYDQSARDATEMARTDPSLGNVAMQTFNRVSGFFGGPQGSLESIGERQLRLANKEINRPRYQKEAYARKMLGITNDQLKARNLQQIRANAEARTRAFNLQKAIRASERSARRLGGNIGTGRDGGFGTGTQGQGLPSNPKGFSGYSRKSSPSTGTGTSPSRSRGGISKSTSRGQVKYRK